MPDHNHGCHKSLTAAQRETSVFLGVVVPLGLIILVVGLIAAWGGK